MWHERVIVPIIMDLERVAKAANEIASSWNGSDNHFVHEGILYSDDEAILYGDIEKTATELIDYLSEAVNLEPIAKAIVSDPL